MLRFFTVSVVLGFAGSPGCLDSPSGPLGRPAQSYFSCKACLADDAARCATYKPDCHDSTEQLPSETAATDALCDTLTPAELARRPTPPDFKPNSPWFKNACYLWPKDAFKIACTRFQQTCDGVPIH